MTNRSTPAPRRPLLPALAVVVLAGAALAGGCAGGDQRVLAGQKHRGGVSASVGDVAVERGGAVTGAITVKAGRVQIGPAATVGGRIQVGNGSVTVGDSARVAELVLGNGQMKLGRNATVGGPVTLANGFLDVAGARVEGLVQLVSGRLEVRRGSLLAAGLRVENPEGLAPDSTYVVIRSGARVEGPLTATGLVRLIVEPGADTSGARLVGVAPEPAE